MTVTHVTFGVKQYNLIAIQLQILWFIGCHVWLLRKTISTTIKDAVQFVIVWMLINEYIKYPNCWNKWLLSDLIRWVNMKHDLDSLSLWYVIACIFTVLTPFRFLDHHMTQNKTISFQQWSFDWLTSAVLISEKHGKSCWLELLLCLVVKIRQSVSFLVGLYLEIFPVRVCPTKSSVGVVRVTNFKLSEKQRQVPKTFVTGRKIDHENGWITVFFRNNKSLGCCVLLWDFF